MTNTTTQTTVAQEIANQIGSRAFLMIGAKNLLAWDAALQFDVGSNAKKVTRVRVELDDSDTYTVTFYAGRGLTIRELASQSFVYADQLHAVIESNTGLYTRF